MGTCPDSVKRLIQRFDHQSDTLRSPDYNETLIRVDRRDTNSVYTGTVRGTGTRAQRAARPQPEDAEGVGLYPSVLGMGSRA